MTALPDAGAWRALAQAELDGDVELAPGELECREFELARAAFDLRYPNTEARMVAAFLRFHQLGFEAFFQGACSVPMAIAGRPQLASMWMDGFLSARMSALAKRCGRRWLHFGGYYCCRTHSCRCRCRRCRPLDYYRCRRYEDRSSSPEYKEGEVRWH